MTAAGCDGLKVDSILVLIIAFMDVITLVSPACVSRWMTQARNSSLQSFLHKIQLISPVYLGLLMKRQLEFRQTRAENGEQLHICS
jgi:hypothetical protein